MKPLRRNIMLGTAGHVDHGKTALVKLLTGCETDTLAEEKQRGLTIDLGFAPCRLADDRIVGVVDVPGHVDFIRNMVAGAHGIDVVILIVAADDGIMPQTLEHLHILTLMGLRHGLVALTKIDLVDAGRRVAVRADLERLFAGTFLDGAPICPISNVTGEGFDGFFDALNQVVDVCADRACHGLFRVWVEDTFTIRGAGTVVTGIPTHGRVRPGDRLQLLPTGLTGHVRRLQVYGEDAAEGRAGECVALNIPEIDYQLVRRGLVLCDSVAAQPVTMAEAELRILECIRGKVDDYLEVQMHVGTASAPAHLAMLETTEMSGGQTQMIQLRLAEPLPLVAGERFVVRANLAGSGVEGLTTLGGGRILGLSNARLRRKRPWTLQALAARREAIDDPVRWCEALLREAEAPVSAADLQPKCWMRPEEITAALEQLGRAGHAVRTRDGGWIHRELVGKKAEELLGAVQAFHAAHPQHAGVSRDELLAVLSSKSGAVAAGSSLRPSGRLDNKLDAQLFELAAELLLQSGRIERRGMMLAQSGWSARLSDRDQRLCDRLAAEWQQAGWAPPGLEDLATALGEPLARISAMARLLAERGIVVRLDDRVWMHRDAVEAGKQAALKLFRKAPRFSTMEFRDALGVSRKYAVPLVDYFDAVRFTVRCGHDRTPGVEAEKLLSPRP